MPKTSCGKCEHLAGHDFFQAVDARDAVADGDDRADFVDGHRLVVVGDLRAQNLCDFVRFDRCHAAPRSYSRGHPLAQAFQLRAHRAVVNRRADAHHGAGHQRRIEAILRLHALARSVAQARP